MKNENLVVFLAAYNDEHNIRQQIQTILKQAYKPSKILISVDQSTDKTLSIIKDYAKEYSEIEIISSGKRFGSSAANFINLLISVDLTDVNYICLADQDDLWNEDKLQKAIQKLQKGYDGYSSNVEAFWEDGRKKVLFKNQPQQMYDHLFESAGPGCTFVYTKKLALALQDFLKKNHHELSQMRQYHDWLIYAFARQNQFKWFIDEYVGMKYRQHSLNDFGAHVGFRAFLLRADRVIQGEGFDQVIRLIKFLNLQNHYFVKKWYPLSRFGFIRLALFAPQCRRRLREQIYFFFSCILLAIIFPKKLHSI